MNIEELERLDNTFNQANFISKTNNMFIKFFTAIMMDNLSEVDHFISDEVYSYGEGIIAPLREHNYKKMFDELNVKSNQIKSIEKINNEFVITTLIQSRYLDYIYDSNNGTVVSGDDNNRVQINYLLTFTKKDNATNQGIAKKCDSCGSPMNINNTGICEYCGSIYKQEKHDWVLTNISPQ